MADTIQTIQEVRQPESLQKPIKPQRVILFAASKLAMYVLFCAYGGAKLWNYTTQIENIFDLSTVILADTVSFNMMQSFSPWEALGFIVAIIHFKHDFEHLAHAYEVSSRVLNNPIKRLFQYFEKYTEIKSKSIAHMNL